MKALTTLGLTKFTIIYQYKRNITTKPDKPLTIKIHTFTINMYILCFLMMNEDV
jgi:hypothetical protein